MILKKIPLTITVEKKLKGSYEEHPQLTVLSSDNSRVWRLNDIELITMCSDSAAMFAMTQCFTYDWVTKASGSEKFLPYYKAWKWAGNKPTASDKARLRLLQAHTLISCHCSSFFYCCLFSQSIWKHWILAQPLLTCISLFWCCSLMCLWKCLIKQQIS